MTSETGIAKMQERRALESMLRLWGQPSSIFTVGKRSGGHTLHTVAQGGCNTMEMLARPLELRAVQAA